MPSVPYSAANRDLIDATAREFEPDRAIAALLSPVEARDDLLSLAAYLGEIRRVPLMVSEPALAEIRLQWWRDALAAGAQGGLTGNPIADEMVRVVARHDIPLDLVTSPLDAASWELGHVDGPGLGLQSGWLTAVDAAETANIAMSASILNAGSAAPAGVPALELAGRAYGRCRLALRIPDLAARGRWPLGVPTGETIEGDVRAIVKNDAEVLIAQALLGLAELRDMCRSMPVTAFPAILPVALIPAYAKAVRRPSRDLLREPAQIAPLTRFFRLWRAARTKRI